MSSPHYIQVPREGNPTPNIIHQSTTYSEQLNAWLREDHKDIPPAQTPTPHTTLPLRAVPSRPVLKYQVKRQVDLKCHITSSNNVPLKALNAQ
ncbi:hypothetical protein Forpi1262_v007266 [Fusarium oxysporum f. sp. raphani]|uniref:Uncharacterized protein n=1 Tax=Fusarium oxysporum f. sp. raphani TaxID=96318 RepID=A0A8J5Q834_FUSOX|nr:hypothetical protein Forpi1262_v007266 [Fusarium oxysporum f. sp. raphani]